jgi:Icc-related predicted phosphoesterase
MKLNMKRIAYCADLHGDRNKYHQFFAIKADCHIIGGDLFPKRSHRIKLFAYQKEFMESFLRPLLEQNKKVTSTFLMLGNDDIGPLEKNILQYHEEGLCSYLHNNIYELENFELIGFQYVPPTPFAMKNFERMDSRGASQELFSPPILFQEDGSIIQIDFPSYLRANPSIAELLEALPKPTDPSKTIYVMHSPPYKTSLDITVKNEHVGSNDIREFLLKNQPNLFLCGHIHESPGTTKLGNTTCINPGQLYEFKYSLFELENNSINYIKIPG